MKNLINKMAEKAIKNQRELTRLCDEFSRATTKEKQAKYIADIVPIYDEMLLLANFYISNEENIAAILDGRERAVKAYQEITGNEYKGEEIDE